MVSSGDYVYRKYAHDLGQLVMQEVIQSEPVHYTLTLVCETGRRGTFVFSQQSRPIKPDICQNTGRYNLSH